MTRWTTSRPTFRSGLRYQIASLNTTVTPMAYERWEFDTNEEALAKAEELMKQGRRVAISDITTDDSYRILDAW